LGLSINFYAEIHSKEFLFNEEFFNDFKVNLMLKSQNKFSKFGKLEDIDKEKFSIEVNSVLAQSERDFLDEIYFKFFNINYLINNMSAREEVNNENNENNENNSTSNFWTLEKLNFEELKKTFGNNILLHNNFHLEKTYDKVFPLYKNIIYPNDLNLNTLIINLINQQNIISNQYFAKFSVFFENLLFNFSVNNSSNFKSFKSLKVPSADEPIVNSLNYNPFAYPFSSEEYRINKYLNLDENFKRKFSQKIFDSNASNSKIHQCIKSLRIKLFRNFQNFDLPNFLNSEDRTKVSNLISEAFECRLEKIEIISENLRKEKDFSIHINTSDHLIFEFLMDFKSKDCVNKISEFLKSFKQICLHSEYKKNNFSIINNVGYRVSDFSLLALGFDLNIELDLDYIDDKTFEKEFNLYKNKYPVSPLCFKFTKDEMNLNSANAVLDKNDSNEAISLNIEDNQTSNLLIIENDKKFDNFFNYTTLQNMLDRFLELISNFKIKEPAKEIQKQIVIEKEIREELDKVTVKIDESNLNTSNVDSKDANVESINLNVNVNSEISNTPINANIENSGFIPDNNLSYEGSSIHLNDSKISDKADERTKNTFDNSPVNSSGVAEYRKSVSEDNDDILIE